MTEFNKPTQEEDWGALAEKHLASIKRDMKISLENAVVRAAHKVMTEFNDTERESKVKQEAVRAAMQVRRVTPEDVKKIEMPWMTQQEVYDELRNGVIEEVAQHIEKLTGFGQDTISSFAIYIRGMKK
jgi:hypothetical protein